MAGRDYRAQSDEALAALAGGGDQEAFGALYERHFDPLYDFAYRIVRTTDGAADVVQHTFARGWERFREGAVPDNVKAWMYVVARNAAIDEVRRGRRAVPVPEAAGEGEPPSPLERLEAGPGPDVDPEAAARARELVQLVWEAADGLGDEQRSLLYLHVRQELSADELADHLGVNKGALYTRLSRLRDSFEEALVALILLRHGRRDCPELDAMLTEMRAVGPSPEVRTAIRAHLEDCPRCRERKRGLVAASEILSTVPPIAAPAALRDRVRENVTATAEVPKRPRRSRTSRMALAAAALAAVAGGSAGGFLLLSAGGPDVRDPELPQPQLRGGPLGRQHDRRPARGSGPSSRRVFDAVDHGSGPHPRHRPRAGGGEPDHQPRARRRLLALRHPNPRERRRRGMDEHREHRPLRGPGGGTPGGRRAPVRFGADRRLLGRPSSRSRLD